MNGKTNKLRRIWNGERSEGMFVQEGANVTIWTWTSVYVSGYGRVAVKHDPQA